MHRSIRIHLFLILALAALPAGVSAYSDDSTDDTWYSYNIDNQCGNYPGQNLRRGDKNCVDGDVYIDKRSNLLRNGRMFSNKKVRDFKVARDGKIYYRSRDSGYLYKDNRRLYSGATGVGLYMLSPTSDIVYLNKNGSIFKNGKKLNSGANFVHVKKRGGRISNPVVSRNGKAIYLNDNNALFVDGKRFSPNGIDVTQFLVDENGNVYYLDKQGRVFKNRRKIHFGIKRVTEIFLGPNEDIALLTDEDSDNLYYRGRKMESGIVKIVDVRFKRNGGIVYKDEKGRRWENGHRAK